MTFSNANKNGRADGQGPQEHPPEELGLGVQRTGPSIVSSWLEDTLSCNLPLCTGQEAQ